MGYFPGINRDGRTGQNKLAKFATMVYFKANGIPQFRSKLPFVD